MRALTPEQRKAHLERTSKSKAKPKAKPGQKGQQTNNKSSKTKSETVGSSKPTATTANSGRYIPGSQQVPIQVPPPPVAPVRSPAASAPIHASPRAFGSVQRLQQPSPSPYVGSSVATPQRPSTPQPSAPAAPTGELRTTDAPAPPTGELRTTDAPPAPGSPGAGPDMERRRAFLDADNSLDGMKAVRELLNRRKLSISVES
jgi:hypothetical protein